MYRLRFQAPHNHSHFWYEIKTLSFAQLVREYYPVGTSNRIAFPSIGVVLDDRRLKPRAAYHMQPIIW